jgi:pyruvate dehydrogenase E2 component (dihydrolipoamide acetyltransferase)
MKDGPMDLEGPTSGTNELDTDRERLYSPLVRRLAEEFEIDLSTVKGTGPGGRVTRADVQAAAESSPSATTAADPAAPTGLVAPNKLVAVPDLPDTDEPEPEPEPAPAPAEAEIDPEPEPEAEPEEADAEVEAAQTFSVTFEVDVSQLVKAQWRLEEVGDLAMPIEALLAALARPALDQFPTMRARIDDGAVVVTDGFDLVIDNVGVGDTYLEPTTTTPTPLTSVMVPGDEEHSLLELADLVTTATESASPAPATAEPTDEDRGSFTIDHVGSTGATGATPVLKPSTTAAVAYGQPRSSLHLVDGTPQERTMMVLTGTFDQRATTTGEAGHFMACLATYLEDPLLAFTL